jgi:hypothetical protein
MDAAPNAVRRLLRYPIADFRRRENVEADELSRSSRNQRQPPDAGLDRLPDVYEARRS